MGHLEDVFTVAFWGYDPPPQPKFIEWKHISKGLSHCPVCLILDKCWFADNNKPKLPQHPNCHCIAKPIEITLLSSSAYALSDMNIVKELYNKLGYDNDNAQKHQKEFEDQAVNQYISGKYVLGKLDKNGQEIRIEVEIKRKHDQESVSVDTVWIVYHHGKILLIDAGQRVEDDTSLYRAVSDAEYNSLVENGGKFKAYDYAMEEKWFATSVEDSIKWGNLFYPNMDYRILEIVIPTNYLKQVYYVEKLDGIGPAYCCGVEFLNSYMKGWWLI